MFIGLLFSLLFTIGFFIYSRNYYLSVMWMVVLLVVLLGHNY